MLGEVEISSAVVRAGPLRNLHLNMKEARELATEISDKRTDQEKGIVNSNGPSQTGACCV